MQVLVLVCVPPPQSTEQLDQDVNEVQPPFIGQLCVLQLWLSDEDPEQSFPPYCGDGFVQVLVLVCVPPPQSTEQLDHDVNELHPPFIGQ